MNQTLLAVLAATAAATFLVQAAPPSPSKGVATGVCLSAMVVWIPAAILIDWATR